MTKYLRPEPKEKPIYRKRKTSFLSGRGTMRQDVQVEREGHAGPSGDEDGCLFSLLDGGEGGGGRRRFSETSIRKNGICFVLKTSQKKNELRDVAVPLNLHEYIDSSMYSLSLSLFNASRATKLNVEKDPCLSPLLLRRGVVLLH